MPTPISAEYVRSILNYDPDTGVFVWKQRPREHFADNRVFKAWNKKYPGTVAGSDRGRGWLQICINDKPYPAHRIAWLYMTGQWADGAIDHANLDKADNRFCNIRLATPSQNGANRRVCKNSKTGIKGVHWNKDSEKYTAAVYKDGKRTHLGYFTCPAAASIEYQLAAIAIHKEFARAA